MSVDNVPDLLVNGLTSFLQANNAFDSSSKRFVDFLLDNGERGLAIDSLAKLACVEGIVIPNDLVMRYESYCDYYDKLDDFEEFKIEFERLKAERASAK